MMSEMDAVNMDDAVNIMMPEMDAVNLDVVNMDAVNMDDAVNLDDAGNGCRKYG